MDEASGVATWRRSRAERFVESLSGSDDPVLAYKAGLLAGMSPETREARALRAEIPGSPVARALLRIFDQDEKGSSPFRVGGVVDLQPFCGLIPVLSPGRSMGWWVCWTDWV